MVLFSVFWSFCPSIFPFVAYPTCLAVQRFLVMSLCLCNTLHTLPSFYLFFGPSLVLHNPLSLSYSIILLPSSVQFPSFFSSLCFVLHFTSHESRCYFFSCYACLVLCFVFLLLYWLSYFCFFTNFPALFLVPFYFVFSSLLLYIFFVDFVCCPWLHFCIDFVCFPW